MKYFCLPADFKMETIDGYHEINTENKHAKVLETYGQMAPDTLFGSCRVDKQLPQVDRNQLEKYIRYCQERKIQFNYVVNATSMENDELTPGGYKLAKDFFMLLTGIGVAAVTIALPSLMEIARYAAPDLEIKASTVCQINSPFKAEFYEKLGIRRLVLDEDIYRRFDVLKSIRAAYTGELEVIVNSFCSNDCPYKMFHYNSLSFSHLDKEIYPYYSSRCKAAHIGKDSFIKLNWIRPEDLHFYEDLGIHHFKLQGRTNVYTGNPLKALRCYVDENYDGDLIQLLELFSPTRSLTISDIAVDNRSLDGFLDRFAHHPNSCKKLCKNCEYCMQFAQWSISSSDLYMLETMDKVKSYFLDDFPSDLEEKNSE